VTNLLAVENVLPSTSTNAAMEESTKSKKKPASAKPSGKTRGRKPYPLEAKTKFDQRKELKKLVKSKRNQKNNLAKNF
jgi:hypothetical protein